MSEVYLSWLAGFFEGEGSCGYYPRKATIGRLMMSVTQKETEVLEEIKSQFGFGSVSTFRTGQPGECGVYQTSNARAKVLLSAILPYMRSTRKREQAMRAINAYDQERN